MERMGVPVLDADSSPLQVVQYLNMIAQDDEPADMDAAADEAEN